MTYTPDQIAQHIAQRVAAVGEDSKDVRILRQLVAQVELADARFRSHGMGSLTDRLAEYGYAHEAGVHELTTYRAALSTQEKAHD